MQASGCLARQVSGLGKSRQVQASQKMGNLDMQATGCWARQISELGKSRQVQKPENPTGKPDIIQDSKSPSAASLCFEKKPI